MCKGTGYPSVRTPIYGHDCFRTDAVDIEMHGETYLKELGIQSCELRITANCHMAVSVLIIMLCVHMLSGRRSAAEYKQQTLVGMAIATYVHAIFLGYVYAAGFINQFFAKSS